MTMQTKLPKNELKERLQPMCDMSKYYKFTVVPLYVAGATHEELHVFYTDKIDLKELTTCMAWVYQKDARGDGYTLVSVVRFGKLEA